jgi:hypothetical protein
VLKDEIKLAKVRNNNEKNINKIKINGENDLLNELLDISASANNSRQNSIERYANTELEGDIQFYPNDEYQKL